jgi:excisionase family DNA binding protein
MKEAAEYTGLSSRTIRRRIADGSITGRRFGSQTIRVNLAELDQLGEIVPVSVSAQASWPTDAQPTNTTKPSPQSHTGKHTHTRPSPRRRGEAS